MKTRLKFALLVTILLAGIFVQSFAQEMSKQDYLKKSRNQKTTGFILLGGGAALIIIGALIIDDNFCTICDQTQNQENAMEGGEVAAIAGGVAMIASVPVLFSAKKNAKKASKLSLNIQPIYNPKLTGKLPNSFPAISLAVPFN